MKSMKKISLIVTVIALCLGLIGAACAETVNANPATIDINRLGDRFVTADLKIVDGKVKMELFEHECFAKEAIENLKAGDVLVTEGEPVTVETAAPDGETGDFYINKDKERQVLLCLNTATGCYEVVQPEDDRTPFIKIGELEDVELNDYLVFLDWSDPDAFAPVMHNGTELEEMLRAGDGAAFDVKNVRVLFDTNNMPFMVWRFYSVAQ